MKPIAIASTALLALAACGGGMEMDQTGTMRMPITTITMLPTGEEYLLQGYIYPLTNFGANFEMETPDGTTCTGSTSPRGQGSMTCSDGLEVTMSIPEDRYGRPSGSYFYAPTGTAVGWGNESDPAIVRAILQAN